MALYEYECGSCGRRFERIQKFSDAHVEICPTCGGPVKRLISSPAIHFKGSGFYINDYGRKDTKDAKEGTAKDTKETGAKDAAEGTKETKETTTKDTKETPAPKPSTDKPGT